ncbi:type VI secretion system protein TssA [Limnoglobus roseus]|uniref:Type VI secretion system protein TssA n=1 Tax=Limnoglobus roseus TaxID=2598579 RepID=A0A5C1AAR6_9BACT|nr:type VI secretion system ImpA family N-terminal domain-containing protein [Limnoglobus roseus]QEL14128.1 type VI secretion system protein TssA [Limnoglobus roseus]
MPSPTVLPVEPLLAPINGDDPAGGRPSILERNKLKEYQEDFDPERDLSAEERQDPRLSEKQKTVPQWDKIIQFGTQFLGKSGKELSVALAMTEALTKKFKFAGLRDGLKLLKGLCDECWDRMHPIIENPDDPDDVEGRVMPFTYIDDEVKTPFFPASVRGITLLNTTGGEPISFLSCQSFDPKRPPKVSQDDFRAAVAAAGPDQVAQLRLLDEDITESLSILQGLVAALDARAGSNAPGLGSLRKALQDCQTMTREALRLRGGEAPAAADAPASGDAFGGDSPAAAAPTAMVGGGSGGGVNVGAIRSRDELYVRLNELTNLLEKFDPHSPVPFMIRRAMEMRDMKFPELVDRLNSDTKLLDFIRNPLAEQS